ncbi:MAG: sulfotransferase [Geminicoccaceae bacterium]
MRSPDFFIVGAPKCGTTSLYTYLADHPDVFMPAIKEPHFFYAGSPTFPEVRDYRRYIGLFGPAGPDQICGEASSCYFLSSHSVEAILGRFPNAKMVAMVRNPVDMIASFHHHKLYSFQEDIRDLARAWALSPERQVSGPIPPKCKAPEQLDYQAVAKLDHGLKAFMETVPENQRLVIVFDDFVKDPADVFAKILDFLGLRSWQPEQFAKKNPRQVHRWPGLARTLMYPPFPLNVAKKGIKRALGPRLKQLGRRLYEWEATPVRPAQLSDELRETLARHLAPEIDLLEGLIGREFPGWRQAAAG